MAMDQVVRIAAIVFLVWMSVQYPLVAFSFVGVCILLRIIRFIWEKIDDFIF